MSDVDQGPSDEELFNSAVSDETPDDPVVAEQVEQPVRDDAGRFAKKEEPVEVVAETPVEKPVVDDNASQVPSWRVREINEEKRAALAELETLRAERAQWQRQQQQPPAQEKPVRPATPDPLLDPDGFRDAVRNELREERLNEQREESLVRARDANQQEFDEAYAAARQAVDPALKAMMQNSRDPGKTLLTWHRENKVKAEVGHDPNAWLEKKLEERLNDPAFLQKAIERSKGIAQQDGRPRIDLPPTLNGTSRSNAALKSSNDDDVSDEELFQQLAG